MAALASDVSFFFDRFRLDQRGLFRVGVAGGDEPVVLGSRALDLLLLLAGRPGEVVSKDTIMEAVWPGTSVEESNLTVQISALRRVLDSSGQRNLIQNIPGRGYRLASAVSRSDQLTAASPATSLSAKPSIAVLPFQNLSGDPEQEYFADGMVEEIIIALSRIPWLFVIARNSSFTYKGQPIDVKRVGRELGVRYVLEGSVRRAGGHVRITAQLIEADTGTHLWADRFDGSLEDVFDLQDQVASRVAGIIEPALQIAETARAAARFTNDLTAYDLYLRAYAMSLSSVRQTADALRLMEQAIALDPQYAPALAWAAICCFRLHIDGRSKAPETYRRKGVDLARRALQLAADDPGILANTALVLAYFGEDIDAMIALIDRALVLNQNYARAWYISGVLRLLAGQPGTAIEHSESSLRLSPRARVGPAVFIIGAAYFLMHRFDDAVTKLILAIQEDPSFPQPYRFLAACYAHMGRLPDARDVINRLGAITSVVIPDTGFLRQPDHRELLVHGLRLAVGEYDQELSSAGKVAESE